MQAVSSTILDQIQKLDPPPRDATDSSRPLDGRQISRGVPISSSRNDPLPQDAFPTPLPNIPLPYELTLLDNLFVNPMVSHNKASEYTCGSKSRLQAQSQRQANGQGQAQGAGLMYTNPTQFNTLVSSTPQSLPPGAFQLPSQSQSSFPGQGTSSRPAQTNTSLGAYGMAAVGSQSTQNQQLDPSNLYQHQTPGGSAVPLPGNTGDEAGFDVFSFLMDEEAGLGNGWDSLEVPSDFSLWT
jgi:hypothetical protein